MHLSQGLLAYVHDATLSLFNQEFKVVLLQCLSTTKRLVLMSWLRYLAHIGLSPRSRSSSRTPECLVLVGHVFPNAHDAVASGHRFLSLVYPFHSRIKTFWASHIYRPRRLNSWLLLDLPPLHSRMHVFLVVAESVVGSDCTFLWLLGVFRVTRRYGSCLVSWPASVPWH